MAYKFMRGNIVIGGNLGVDTKHPLAKLDVNGSLSVATRYLGDAGDPPVFTRDADTEDFHFDMEPTTTPVSVQLPTLASSVGTIYSFKKVIAGGNTATVYAQAGECIDDDCTAAPSKANVTLSSNGEAIILINAGGRWRSIAHMTSNP
jgi:hypothetical protein